MMFNNVLSYIYTPINTLKRIFMHFIDVLFGSTEY